MRNFGTNDQSLTVNKNLQKPKWEIEEITKLEERNSSSNLCNGSDHKRVVQRSSHLLQWCKEEQQGFCCHAQEECTKWACPGHCSLQAQHILEERDECCLEMDHLDRLGNQGRKTNWTHKSLAFASSSCKLQGLELTWSSLKVSSFSSLSLPRLCFLEIFKDLEFLALALSLSLSLPLLQDFVFLKSLRTWSLLQGRSSVTGSAFSVVTDTIFPLELEYDSMYKMTLTYDIFFKFTRGH